MIKLLECQNIKSHYRNGFYENLKISSEFKVDIFLKNLIKTCAPS